MNLADVMDEIGDALRTIPGLNVFPYWANRVTAPAAVVGWPDPLTYDTTYGRGSDRVQLAVMVLVGGVDAESSRNRAAAYADGSGPSSVKAALDALEPTSCDSVAVTRCDFEVISVAATDYLSATFTLDITGTGA